MNVKELMDMLDKMDPDEDIYIFSDWDSSLVPVNDHEVFEGVDGQSYTVLISTEQ